MYSSAVVVLFFIAICVLKAVKIVGIVVRTVPEMLIVLVAVPPAIICVTVTVLKFSVPALKETISQNQFIISETEQALVYFLLKLHFLKQQKKSNQGKTLPPVCVLVMVKNMPLMVLAHFEVI